MTDIDIKVPGTKGQTKSSWRNETSLRGVLVRLLQEHPTEDDESLAQLFVAKVEMNETLIHEAARYAFDNHLAQLRRKPGRRPHKPVREDAVAAVVGQIAEVVLLDLVMPNGKRLRDCTGAECRQAGGWYVAVADRVGDDNVVGTKIDETEAAALFAGTDKVATASTN